MREASLRTHLSDAAYHARCTSRSLALAAEKAPSDSAGRKLMQISRMAGGWAARLEPKRADRRARRSR